VWPEFTHYSRCYLLLLVSPTLPGLGDDLTASIPSPESLIKLIYSLVWAVMIFLPIQRRVYEWVACLFANHQKVTDRTPQISSFPSFRHSRYSRKTLHRGFCPSASGRHGLALRLGPLKGVLSPLADKRLLRCWAGLGIHSTLGDISAVPKPIFALCPGGSVGVWVWDVVLDTVWNAMILLISFYFFAM
jgi:hypothetical protein